MNRFEVSYMFPGSATVYSATVQCNDRADARAMVLDAHESAHVLSVSMVA
jgi:hypothetical protein